MAIRTINTDSSFLFLKAIRTLELTPHFYHMELLANGIKSVNNRIIEDDKRYINECKQFRVMPYTKLYLEHKGNNFNIDKITAPGSQKEFVESLNYLLSGGRFHEISIKSNANTQFDNSFNYFKKEFLDKFIEENYKLTGGDIWLSSHYLKIGCYDNGGYIPESRIEFGSISLEKGLKLSLEGKMPEGDPDGSKINKWFENLKNL